MTDNQLAFLRELIDRPGPSGFEQPVTSFWLTQIEHLSDKTWTDALGNSIAVRNPCGNPKVMLMAHADEVGYMVQHIDEDGYIRFAAIGRVDEWIIPGQRVTVVGSNGTMAGVVGKRAAPQMSFEDQQNRKLELRDMWIDTGAMNAQEVRDRIQIGDPIVMQAGMQQLSSTRIAGRALDNRIGLFIIGELMKLLQTDRCNDLAVYCVATVQEELGSRGAETSSWSIKPEIGIAVDVVSSTDTPGTDNYLERISLGKGPVLVRGPSVSASVFDCLLDAAKAAKIAVQIKPVPHPSGADVSILQLNCGGVFTGLVCVPIRYIHTPVEVADIRDIFSTIELLRCFVKSIANNRVLMDALALHHLSIHQLSTPIETKERTDPCSKESYNNAKGKK